MIALAPCLECGRHVRADETACPFCGSSGIGVPVAPRYRGLTRAAIFVAGAALAACGTADGEPEEPEQEEETIMQPYGAPPNPDPDPVPPPQGPQVPPEAETGGE